MKTDATKEQAKAAREKEISMKELKQGPLSDVNILDFTWVLAGPHATKTFADMGANVIKVEAYKTGAIERYTPLMLTNDGVTQSSYSINVNRGKKSLCINLKSTQGLEIIRELIKRCDIIVENFAPGVMDRLALDYESCRKIKENIIYCSISSFGHWGPYSHKPGYDMIAQGASGWTSQSDPEIIAPVSIGDTTASMHACTAILAAVYHREKTGKGQNIDISMMDCLFSLHENTLPWYMISEVVGEPVMPPKIGTTHPGYAPYGIYKGKNGSITIACITENRWNALMNLMGPEYAWLKDDPRCGDVASRCSFENAPVIHKAVEEWIMSFPSVEEAERVLDEAGIPSLRVRSLVELATKDPQIKAREMMPRVYQPFLGSMMMYGSPLKMSETPCGIRRYAPFVGEHNKEILQDFLGYKNEYIDALYEENVLYREEAVGRLPEEISKAVSK
jgi:crotonobetainyl-CoA:carnitine CoA-transferase CaiB-like acyl-CoA transferase